jgi:hypothetical protein
MPFLSKIKSNYFSTTPLILFLVTLIMASCGKQCNPKKTTNYNYGEPQLYLSEDRLIGDQKVVELTVETQDKKIILLNDFRIKVTLEEENGTDSKVLYQDKDNIKHEKTDIDEVATHFTSKQQLNADEKSFKLPFTLEPGKDVTKLTASFTIFNIKENRVVNTKSVTWYQADKGKDIQLSLEELSKQLEGDNKTISFKIRNGGLSETEENKLSLQLTRVLGSYAAPIGNDWSVIDPAKGIYTYPLKNLKIGGKQADERQIIINTKQDKKVIFSIQLLYDNIPQGEAQEVIWKAYNWPLDIVISDNKTQIEGTEEITLTITNEGEKAINTDDIIVQFKSTNGVQFKLGQQTGDTIIQNLTTILNTSNTTLNRGNTTGPISLQLSNNNKQINAGITLITRNKDISQEIAPPLSLRWVKLAYPLQATMLTPSILVGDKKKIQLQLNHKGTSSLGKNELEEIIVEVVHSTHANQLKYNGISVHGQSLWALLGKPVAPNSSQHLEFTIDTGAQSEIDLTLMLQGVKDSNPFPIKWAQPDILLSLASEEQLMGNNKNVQLKFTNQGIALDQAALTNIKIRLTATAGTQLQYNGQNVDGKSLADLSIQALDAGEEKMLNFTVNAGTEFQSEFDISLIGNKNSKRVVVQWNKVDIALELLSDHELVDGNKAVKLSLTNQGAPLDLSILEKVFFQVTSTQNGRLIKDGQDINNKPLTAFITQGLDEDEVVELEFELETGEADQVELSINLQEVENPTPIKPIRWYKHNVKIALSLVSLTNYFIGNNKYADIKITNNGDEDLEKGELKKLIFQVYAPHGGKLVLQDGKDLNGQSLWEILGKKLPKTAFNYNVWDDENDSGEVIELSIDPQGHNIVDFTITLRGVPHKNPVNIKWSDFGLKVYLQNGENINGEERITIFGDNKIIRFDFINIDEVNLQEDNLKQITFQVDAPQGGKLRKKDGEDMHQKSLWDISKNSLSSTQGVTIDFMVDPEGKEDVKFTIRLEGIPNLSPKFNVHWRKDKIKISFDSQSVTAEEPVGVTLNSKLGSIKANEITVSLKSEGGNEFTLLAPNGRELGAISNLKELLGNNIEGSKNTIIEPFKFKRKGAKEDWNPEEDTDKVTIIIKKGSQQFEKTIEWEREPF